MAGKVVPSLAFKNGYSIPIIGLGTWKSQPGEVSAAVKEAIDVGYRHFDCARIYGNEREVGEGIKAKIQDGTVKREDLFITSKLWISDTTRERIEQSVKKQLEDLGLTYLDLYLMHWPVSFKAGDEMWPTLEDGTPAFGHNDFVDTYRGLEECQKKGLMRSIGVSNFNKRQLERILNEAEIPPATNQVECHPYFPQKKLIEFCRSKGIVVSAYSPLGSPDRPLVDPDHPILLEEPIVLELAKKYNKSPAQILIRYQIDCGNAVLPKSVTPSRIKSNFQVFDFKLSPSDIASLENFKEVRYLSFPRIIDHPEYPFKEPF